MSGYLGITNPFATVQFDPMKVDKAISDIEQNRLYGENVRSQIAERQSQIDEREAARTARANWKPDFGEGTGTVQPGAPATAPTSDYAGGIAGFESGGTSNPPDNPYWPQARGGPAGPHQFIASTWNSFAQANPDLFKGMSPEQVLAARNNLDLSTKATKWYAGQNAATLQQSGIAPTPANLGIAHALGPGGAAKVLAAPDATPLAQLIPETLAQNPQYRTMTVGQLRQKYARLGPVDGQQPPGSDPTFPPYQVATTGAAPGPPTQPPAAAPGAPGGPGGQIPQQIVESAKLLRAMPEADAAALYPKMLETLRGAGIQMPNAPATYTHAMADQLLERAAQQPTAAPPAAPPAPPPAAAQPPAAATAPAPTPAAPSAVATLPTLNRANLTTENVAQLKQMMADPKITQLQVQNAQSQMAEHNLTRRHQAETSDRLTRQETSAAEERRLTREHQAKVETRLQADADLKLVQSKEDFPGNSDDAANKRVLLRGTRDGPEAERTRNSPEYAAAYGEYAQGKVGPTGVALPRDMTMFAEPGWKPPGSGGKGGRDYGTVTPKAGPDPVKLREAETQAAPLLDALEVFRDRVKTASLTERTKAAAGQPTGLTTAWTNLALLAKGDTLFKLGVLTGPDLEILRKAVADPSTFRGFITDDKTVDDQLNQIKTVVTKGLESMRNYGKAPAQGGGGAQSGADPQEGKIAVNPQTGAKLIRRGGQWVAQ